MPGVHLIVDPGAPVCLIVPLTLHCLPADEAADVAASYMHRLAPGNLLAATCWRVDPPLQWAPVSSSAAASNPDISGVTFTVTDSPPASSSRAAAKSETSGTTVTGREPVMDRPGPLGEGTRVRGDANVYRQVPDLLVQKSEASGTTGTVTAPMFSPTPCLRSEVSAMTWAVAVIPPAPTSIRLARSCSSGLTATVMDSPPTCSSRTAPEVGGVRGDGYGQWETVERLIESRSEVAGTGEGGDGDRQAADLLIELVCEAALTHDAEAGASTPMLMAKSGHTSMASLASYARPSAEALARWQERNDPARRRWARRPRSGSGGTLT